MVTLEPIEKKTGVGRSGAGEAIANIVVGLRNPCGPKASGVVVSEEHRWSAGPRVGLIFLSGERASPGEGAGASLLGIIPSLPETLHLS